MSQWREIGVGRKDQNTETTGQAEEGMLQTGRDAACLRVSL